MPQIMDTPGVPDRVKPNVDALRRLMLENRDVDVSDNLLELLPKRKPEAGRVRVRRPDLSRGAQAQGRQLPTPLDDTRELGGPQRPKIRDIGGGKVRVVGYHATPDLEDWMLGEDPIHMGTQRAALHRMATPSWGPHGEQMSDIKPHALYELTVEAPRERFSGLDRRWGDLEANELDNAARNRGASEMQFSDIRRGRDEIPVATRRGRAAYAYRNSYEDPGSTSWLVTDPSAVTRVNRIYDAGSRGLGIAGLVNMFSSFLGGPSLNTPADWVIQDLMQNLDASPWNPKNQPGYTVPA